MVNKIFICAFLFTSTFQEQNQGVKQGFGERYYDVLHIVMCELKVNFTLQQATKAQKWSTGIALLFL